MNPALVNFAYIVASILFIFGIKMLGSAATARRGNRISAIGMLLAIVVTLLDQQILGYAWILVGIVVGSAIGVIWARKVEMTGMPELVALFNGFGGAASLLVGWAEFVRLDLARIAEAKQAIAEAQSGVPGINLEAIMAAAAASAGAPSPAMTLLAIGLAVLIGGVTLTGSLVAYAKLSGKVSGAPMTFPSQKVVNIGLVAGGLAAAILLGLVSGSPLLATLLFTLILFASLSLGITGTLPIGGGDMPVVISLLNSLSGLAAAAAGFVIANKVLIVAGCLVGASGLILTVIMCKAMNRSLINVLVGGFGGSGGAAADGDQGEMKAASVEDAYYILEAASSVVIVPGYGMAVAQAQHAVKELGEALEANGAEVRYAIHPVAGRMPGHMNVLLAEADVDYDQLVEMDAVNPIMPTIDVAIVVGANDVVNPAAGDDPGSPIYGMPIINVHEAKTVFCLKRGKGTGFSGLQNALFFRENTRMIFGDAKASITALGNEFKA